MINRKFQIRDQLDESANLQITAQALEEFVDSQVWLQIHSPMIWRVEDLIENLIDTQLMGLPK